MGIYSVKVGVAHSRPPLLDAVLFYRVESETPLSAELMACQWAASRPDVVMPVSSEVLTISER